jgi:hypothetical protein
LSPQQTGSKSSIFLGRELCNCLLYFSAKALKDLYDLAKIQYCYRVIPQEKISNFVLGRFAKEVYLMHPVQQLGSESQSLPPHINYFPSLFGRIQNYFWPPAPSLPPLSVEREVVPLKVDSPREVDEQDDTEEMNFESVIPQAINALQNRPAPPMFVSYTITVKLLPDSMKSFEVTTLEQEEIVMKELADLVDKTSEPVVVYAGLPDKESAERTQSYLPHQLRVRELFERNFTICKPGQYFEAIGSKVAKEEDGGDGTTKITYHNGKVTTVLQPYSEARHPWARQTLEKGIELSSHAIELLQQAMPKLMSVNPNSKQANPDGIRLFDGKNLVFSLDAIPGVVFKRASIDRTNESANKKTAERFEKMLKAQFICQALGLDHLVIPSAKKIEVEYLGQPYLFIAEERLNVDTDRSAQEERYRKYSCEYGCEMNKSIKQLILFCLHTKVSDISWRNFPLFKNNVVKVALIDLDGMDTSVSLGLLGTGEEPERGLLNCLFSEEQIDAVVEAVRPYDSYHEADKMKQRRLQELVREAKLQQFYLEKSLLQEPRRAIDIESWTEKDWQKLGLNLEETSQRVSRKEIPSLEMITLRQAVVDIVNAINCAIKNAPPEASIKGARCALFNMDDCANAHIFEKDNERAQLLLRLVDYGRSLGLHKAEKSFHQIPPEELGQYLWFDRIAHALVQAGHLCYFEKKRANYILQA